jgi:predicted CXXCH cytochrome family protein
MRTQRSLIIVTVLGLMIPSFTAWAVDPPHWAPKNPWYCGGCHVSHNAGGADMTKYAGGNANLCLSCHTSGGSASNKPFEPSMQAVPGTSGSSHRWDGVMPGTSSPTNTYGLRPASSLTIAALRNSLTKFGSVVCSVCHDAHSQSLAAWDNYAGPYTGPTITARGGDSGAASAAGSATLIVDTTKASFWTANAWQNYFVKLITSASSANVGQVRLISGNTTTRLTVSAAFPATVQSGDKYEIIGRHFQRAVDDINQICEDCHYYRVQTHTRIEGGDGAYPADGTNVFSHPVGQTLNANAKGYDRSAPLDVNGVAQSGTRFATGGESPDKVSNNLTADSGNLVRCLTCHRVHYTDSNSLSNGLP